MGNLPFKPLYREDKPAVHDAGQAGTGGPAGSKPGRFRLMAGLGMLFLGFLLFSLQSLTTSAEAEPHRFFYILWVDDVPEESTGENAPVPEPTDTRAHYYGTPSEDFSARFERFASSLSKPAGTKTLRVELMLREARYVVHPGTEPGPEDGDIFGGAQYIVMKLHPDDAPALLGRLPGFTGDLSAGYYLGPYPYNQGGGPWELVLPEDREPISGELPGDASALQGFILTSSAEIAPNALLLVDDIGLSVSGFSEAISGLVPPGEGFGEMLKETRIYPALRNTDMRHGVIIFAAAIAGELLFILGGFLLFYHLFAALGGKPDAKGKLIGNLLRGACRLVTANQRLYWVVTGLTLFFWVSGMVYAYADPGGQMSLIQWFRGQFAGGGWPLGTAGWAYASGNLLLAAGITFLINFGQGTFLVLTLPSLLPIAGGFIVNALRNEMLGIGLAPTTLIFGQSKLLHLPTILLELQGYLLAAYLSVILLLGLIKPARFGFNSRGEAYKNLAIDQFRILPLIAVILLVAALYEAIELLILARL